MMVVIVFAVLCFRLGHLPLLAPDEGRNAEVGREVKESGAWLVPTYNGVDYLDKPAFYFKAVALSLSLFGDNETAARIPSAAFGLALLVMVFLFCWRIHSQRCGLLAVMIVATTPLFLVNARTVIFDIALAFFVCGAILAGYLAEEAEGKWRRRWYLLGAASAGFATLVKGPVGFLIPVLVLLVFNLVEGRRDAWRRLLAPLNWVVFFAITLPWFVGLCLAHRDFLQYGLVQESFNRFLTARTFHRHEPFYFYLVIVAAMFLPWSLLLPEASVATWKEWWWKNSADRLCVVWSVVVIVFFSLSQSKLPGYILSVTVACGILVARLFDVALAAPDARAGRLVRRVAGVSAGLCLVGVVAVVAGAFQWPTLVKSLRIPAGDAEQLSHVILPLAVVLAGFGVFALLAWFRRSPLLCFVGLTLFPPLCVHANAGAFEVVFEAKSGRRLARQLGSLPPRTQVACLECFPNGLPFYLGRTATLISSDGSELTSNYIVSVLEKTQHWPTQIVRLSDFDHWLASRTTAIYLIVRDEDREKLQALAAARSATAGRLSPGLWGAQLPAPTAP
jgi:4-amino-4-deoxy-L-arabinose transferase-like glycosyltransferase